MSLKKRQGNDVPSTSSAFSRGHKRKHKDSTSVISSASSPFHEIAARMTLSLSPVFVSNPLDGIAEMLDSLVMRYVPQFKAVLIAHSNIKAVDPMAVVQGDSAFATVHISFSAMVWRPIIGQKLKGIINICSNDHIGLLHLDTFNVSVSKENIPTHLYDFEYLPVKHSVIAEEGDEVDGTEKHDYENTITGKWIHKDSGEQLGGVKGKLEFAVTGITVANKMLSLLAKIVIPESYALKKIKTKSAEEVSQPTKESEDDDLSADAKAMKEEKRKRNLAKKEKKARKAEKASKQR